MQNFQMQLYQYIIIVSVYFNFFETYLENVLDHILEITTTETSKILSYSLLFKYFYEESLKIYILCTNPALTAASDKPAMAFRRSKIRSKELEVLCHLSAIPTIHVIVSSRLLPPPPPTSEGATLGARKIEKTRKITTKYVVSKNITICFSFHQQVQ